MYVFSLSFSAASFITTHACVFLALFMTERAAEERHCIKYLKCKLDASSSPSIKNLLYMTSLSFLSGNEIIL
uniref:Uncharacterized protein n=1 Tax=Populus trichocarpa TaxID=3694 RepID=B9HAS4_POPTR